MDWLIQLVFLIICLGLIWGFVNLIRRSSRNNKILRWLWILGLSISSFLFVHGILASIGAGTAVFYACQFWEAGGEASLETSYCATPETQSQVAHEFWLQAMTPPSLRKAAVCWTYNDAQQCRYASELSGWDYYLLQTGIGLFFGLVLGFLTWRLTVDSRKAKEKAKVEESTLE
jgi:hypothetical protein